MSLNHGPDILHRITRAWVRVNLRDNAQSGAQSTCRIPSHPMELTSIVNVPLKSRPASSAAIIMLAIIRRGSCWNRSATLNRRNWLPGRSIATSRNRHPWNSSPELRKDMSMGGGGKGIQQPFGELQWKEVTADLWCRFIKEKKNLQSTSNSYRWRLWGQSL